MRWNSPATSQKEELLFAINEMKQGAREGMEVKNATLECIVGSAKVYGTDGKVEGELTSKQQRTAANLILEAWQEATRSNLWKKTSFTAEVARNLRALKANEECIQVARSLISAGGRCRHQHALEEGIFAAVEERDQESLELITEVYERSGYNAYDLYH